MNPHTVHSNTTNRNLQAQTAPAELAVAENPPPLLDVQPVEVPQNPVVRAELAAVEDLADHQSIEAKEEEFGEALSAEKTFLENLLSLASELQSKILGQMHMQSLDDLAPLLEAIAQEIQELRALEDAQRPAGKISSLRQLAQLAQENRNGTPQLSASIASLLEAIDKEVEMLQALGVEEGPASKTAKLRALAHLAVENVCINRLSLGYHKTYAQFMECTEKLSVIKGDALGDFQFKLVKEIIIDSNQVDLLPRFFSSRRTVTINAQGMSGVSDHCMRALGQLSNLTRLIFIRCTSFSKIRPLGQLNNLTDLILKGCQKLSDISALGQLSNLTKLDLRSCYKLSDVGPLGQLSNLTELELDGCQQLFDIRPLGQLNNLTCLWLVNCKKLNDIGALGQLSRLTQLVLDGCQQLTDIGPLRQLSHLTQLCLYNCVQLTDISFLGQLSRLTVLGLSNSQQLIDISPLINLRNLKTIYLNGCLGLTNISPLTQLNHLQNLDLTGCLNLNEASWEILEDLRKKNVNVKFNQ